MSQAIPLDWLPAWVRAFVAGAAVAYVGSEVLRRDESPARIEEVVPAFTDIHLRKTAHSISEVGSIISKKLLK